MRKEENAPKFSMKEDLAWYGGEKAVQKTSIGLKRGSITP